MQAEAAERSGYAGKFQQTCNSRSQRLQEFRSCRMARRLSALRMWFFRFDAMKNSTR